ncbi:MAG: alpha/beta hydrolase [Alphaproteobacteria bacterium]|nr:alpha/beta hydrolase [Alphaproteobacteria bacterium]
MGTRQSETVNASFGTVEVHRWGEGGRPVVILHAAATGPRAYGPLADLLADTGWSCVVPALHGYGASLVDAAADTVDGHVAIARWAVETSGAEAVFGHSMGGLVALLGAETLNLDRLVLFEPILFDALDPVADAALIAAESEMAAAMVRTLAEGRPEDAVRAFVEVWNDTSWSDLPEPARARLTDLATGVVADTQATGTATIGKGVWSAAPPTTLIHGDRSPEIVRHMVAGARRRMPGARVERLPGLGHMAPLLSAPAVAAALVSALGTPS